MGIFVSFIHILLLSLAGIPQPTQQVNGHILDLLQKNESGVQHVFLASACYAVLQN